MQPGKGARSEKYAGNNAEPGKFAQLDASFRNFRNYRFLACVCSPRKRNLFLVRGCIPESFGGH
jgi:hypothetical protein